MDALASVGAFSRFCVRGVRVLPRMDRRETLDVAASMAFGTLLVTLAVTAFAGAMLTVQGFASLKAFGTPELLGMFISLAGVREVFPLIAAGCIGAKLGSALAAEVATLRTGQQLDALEVMGIEPLEHLLMPRMTAATLVTPLLAGLGVLCGLGASGVIATLQLGVDPGAFWARALDSIHPRDIAAGLTKALAFGALTGSLGCWHGYTAGSGPWAVGRAANLTVVQLMVVGALVNLLLSHLFYGGLL